MGLQLITITLAAFSCRVAHSHGILAKPSSKSSGTLLTSKEESLTTYFALASFGIVDKAFFDGDHSKTPWTRPGEFSYEHARDLIQGHPQTLHPCGCNAGGVGQCVGVGTATGFGETTLGAAQGTPNPVTPPEWLVGSQQETAWNAYANHSGGYIYMLCKKTLFDACRDTHLPNGANNAEQSKKDAYLNCVWSCFESNTLEWVPGSQKVQYQDDVCSYVNTDEHEKAGKAGRIWRFTPIPDTVQVTLGGEGKCTWDSVTSFSNSKVEAKFIESFGTSDVCDTGPDQHGPKDWHVIDRVKVPDSLPPGEYLLGWRWDSYMADQLWTGCADVQIVNSSDDSSASKFSEPECPSESASPSTPPTKDPVVSSTGVPVSNPTKAPGFPPPTKAPSINVCSDMDLPGNWGAGGIHTCDTYEIHGGAAYCAHAVLSDACCFCGGGLLGVAETYAPTKSPTCVDRNLPGNWGANGIYTCDYYENNGGTAYCAHADVANACCFCGGGD